MPGRAKKAAQKDTFMQLFESPHDGAGYLFLAFVEPLTAASPRRRKG